MEPDNNSESKTKEESLRVIFDETVPKPNTLRLIISVAIYYSLVQLLDYYESPIYLWVISFIAVGIINIVIWAILREFQFSRFKKGST